ncbi:MAG TPA: diacylglycerol kinase family protein [Thermohalobaculum sp.]|nr:diacylglycerol kinase family protein [Thermohalobaculum sp.]
MRVGLISNPRSHGNRRSGGLAGAANVPPEVIAAAPRGREALAETLRQFADRDVRLIAVDGGDGTVRDVLSLLDGAYGHDWPAFALLPSGKTNAVAGDLGAAGRGRRGLDRLLGARQAGRLRTTERPALEVAWSGGRVRGFLFGAAAFAEGVRLANERLHPAGLHHGLAVAAAIGGMLRRSMRGAGDAPAAEARLEVDGVAVGGERHFLILASTLERLTPGLRPFPKEGEGPVNWLDVAAPPVLPVRGLLWTALGQRRGWMARGGYAGGRARRLDIVLKGPFVIDGETYAADSPVTLAASRPIRFVRP